MFWPILNTLASVVAAAIITYKLACLHDHFSRVELAGLSLIGAGLILTIGPILSTAPTPFEDWSGTMIRVGLSVYFVGRMLTHRRH